MIKLLKMKKVDKKCSRKTLPVGSALILTVVLTSLLAIIGVLFVLVSRVDKMATSSISENKELNFAVEAVVAKISQELTLDVPGVERQEYYDYPGVNDTWLASLEPYIDGTVYKWRQISDVYNKLDPNLQLQADTVPDYQYAINERTIADADGDGVADSRWVIIPEMSSGKGKPIYAAVRIIDNGAMLNVNTGFKFNPILDPNDPEANMLDIGGPDQLQINLLALALRDPCDLTPEDETNLLAALLRERANSSYGLNPWDFVSYRKNVIWNYGEPNGPYTPFGISDELELRNRFLLRAEDSYTRLEQLGSPAYWTSSFRIGLEVPAGPGGVNLDGWFSHVSMDPTSTVLDPNIYDYRHITTTYNMDRIINPIGLGFNGGKMVNVNKADENLLYDAIRAGLLDAEPNFVGVDQLAAQLAVNIVDLRDAYHSDPNAEVTVLPLPDGSIYYGLEVQPFISDIAFKISSTRANISTNNHFAIELYNPFDALIPLSSFRLEIRRHSGEVVGTINLDGYVMSDYDRFVVTNNSGASNTFGISGMMSTGGGKEDPALVLAEYDQEAGSDPRDPNYVLKEEGSYDVYLIRTTRTIPPSDIYLDRQQTKDNDWFGWNNVKDVSQYYSRADNDWNVVLQNMVSASNTLGTDNRLNGARTNYNFYDFASAFERFASVGDIARVLTIGPRPTTEPEDMIGMRLTPEPAENTVRLDLQNPLYENIFQYLTVIDPNDHGLPEGETRIKGRINVNTAPWFVIAQLPWMTESIAQAIVAYRDKLELVTGVVDYSEGRGVGMVDLDPVSQFLPEQVREDMGFASITELLNVTHALANEIDPNIPYNVPYNDLYDIRKYGRDKELGNDKDHDAWPDLTPNDGAENDFEERDLIFSRISNIITVRSDVFTAYILVRIGVDGPQKRVLAILDRSRVTYPGGKVRILALHPVPDPR